MRIKQVIFSFIILFLVILLIPLLLPISFPGINRMLLDVTPTGILSIEGAAPQVLNIYADDKLADYTINQIDKPIYDTDCNVQPVEITAEIYDENGDCDLMHLGGDGGVTAYVCNASRTGLIPYCDSTTADFTINPSSFTLDVDNDLVCNLTANLDWSFYQRWGNWSINITVVSPAPESKYNSSNGTFYRTPHQEFIYPPGSTGSCSQGGTVNLGSVNMGEYNNGTGCGAAEMPNGCWLKNVGNIRLNITWNASIFNHTVQPLTYSIDTRYGNFSVDKDTTHTDGAEVYMSDDFSHVEFPTDSDRVERCGGTGGVSCDNDEDGNTYAGGNSKARFDIYWHINIPTGLLGGNYQNKIVGSQHEHYDSW